MYIIDCFTKSVLGLLKTNNFENCLISFTEMADFVTKQERVQVALATWSEDKLTKMGHQFKDMFRECTYRGKSCM